MVCYIDILLRLKSYTLWQHLQAWTLDV
uniref:Uncharacterized protein n=1 Tax=Arundo donax TaxID=35708 RepID=A0A0A9ES07_ARUDO